MQVLKSMVSAVVLGTLLFAAPTLRADEAMKHDCSSKGGHWDKFDRLKKKLDLSEGQVKRLRDGEKGQMAKNKLLQDKTKADEADLAVLVDEKASAGDLKTGLKALEEDHKAMQVRHEERMDLYKDVLTPMQQAKLVVMMLSHRHGHRGFQGGEGPRGGWGGPHPGMRGQGGDKMHGGQGGMQGGPGADQVAPDNGGGADPSGD